MATKTDTRMDPLGGFCFKVTLPDVPGTVATFFRSVSGLRYETEVIPLRAGGANDTTFNLVGGMKWSPLVFKLGFTKDSGLLAWRELWTKDGKKTRTGGTIIQLDTTLQVAQAEWTFVRGWPSKWEISEFDASKSELSIETLEICHEGLTYKAAK
jgi:phage tail-like protein